MANYLRMAKVSAILTLKEHGWSQRCIAKKLGVHRDTVGRYVHSFGKYWHKYEEHGINAMTTRTKRRRKANAEALRGTTFALLHLPPSSHGVNRTTWTMKDLQNALRSEGNPACTCVIRSATRLAGLMLTRSSTSRRYSNGSTSPPSVHQFNAIHCPRA